MQNYDYEIYYASAMFAGHGHYKITLELCYDGQYKEFKHTTTNMPSYDAANELQGKDKYQAYFNLIKHNIEDEISEWLQELKETI